MSKGIAINTILYLLLGIIVVGIIIYLVYSYAGGGQLDPQECRAKIISWCTGCSVAGWADGIGTITAGSDLANCIDDYFPTSGTWGDAECDANDDGELTETFCQAFI